MSTTVNSAYKVHVQETTEANKDSVNIEQGAMQVTDEALYMGFNGSNVIVYPQTGTRNLGWARYNDGQYTSASKLSLADGVLTLLPNNAATVVRSDSSIAFYNSTTGKVLGTAMNDVFMLTIVFKASAANANQTYLTIEMDNINGTEYSRLSEDLTFPRGNDAEHNFHNVFQYYVDADFVTNGATWRIKATGGTAQVWDIIYFIQRTQNAI
jgi:hypothetical protein